MAVHWTGEVVLRGGSTKMAVHHDAERFEFFEVSVDRRGTGVG